MKKIACLLINSLVTASLFAQVTPAMEKPRPELRSQKPERPATNVGQLPKWIDNAVIYEVNLRQFTPSGTLREFMPHLDRLQQMGVKILWFMPVQPIGIKGRKGSLGSYYSIKDYYAINPEHGTMEEWNLMVKKAHQLGMKVILDWVGNHTSYDHAWITSHPEYYTKDDKGNIIPPVADWSDVADLNYDNKEMRQAMIDAMRFWLRASDIDGFRCDVAEMVPVDFWQECIRDLRQAKRDIFMLAEGEKVDLHNKAFDMTYTWSLFGSLNEIAAGKKNVKAIDEYLKAQELYPRNAVRMYFTSNHDENSWNGSNWEKMGEKSQAFSVLSYALNGMPLIYSGQEAGMKKRLRFFDKDTIDFRTLPLAEFYTRLNKLKATELAMVHGEKSGDFVRLKTGADEQVFACLRKKDNSKVLFVINLSAKNAKIKMENAELGGDWTEVFDAAGQSLPFKANVSLNLEPWTYKVYRFKKS
jgi:glycosidase